MFLNDILCMFHTLYQEDVLRVITTMVSTMIACVGRMRVHVDVHVKAVAEVAKRRCPGMRP